MLYKILLIEDDTNLAQIIAEFFNSRVYRITISTRGKEAYHLAQHHHYDLILMDLCLPDCSGVEIVRRLRDNNLEVPIMIMSSKDGIDDIVKGFNSGVDGYLIKPFNFRELKCRVDSLLTRPPSSKKTLLKSGDIKVDPNTMRVFRRNKEVQLRRKELQVLMFFLRHPNQVITRDELLNNVWQFESDDIYPSTVDSHISHIRCKLKNRSGKEVIRTIHGIGYKLQV